MHVENPHPRNSNDIKQPPVQLQQYYYSGFIVEAYKKPEFKITVEPQAKWILRKEKAKFNITGAYYFGAPLANVELTLRWYSQPMHYYYSYFYDYGYDEIPYRRGGRGRSYGGKVLLKEEKIKLDGQGKATAEYLAEVAEDYSYIVLEARATDASRRLVVTQAQLKCVKHDVYLGLNTDKWHYNKGDSVKVTLTAFTMDDKPYKGAAKLRLKQDRSIEWDQELGFDNKGTATYGFVPETPGQYVLEAEVKDTRGKVVFVSREFTVIKKKQIEWEWEQITLTMDKKEYAIGDTVRITARTGADNVPALFSIEGGNLKAYQINPLKGHQGTYTYIIPRDQGINFYASMAFSGRLNMATQGLKVPVVDSSLILIMKLAGPEKVKPGETYRGTIMLTDYSGTPVEGSFSLAMVDESIFDVAEKSEYKNSNRYYYYESPADAKKEKRIWDHFTMHRTNYVQSALSDFNQGYIAKLGTLTKTMAEPSVSPAKKDMGAGEREESKMKAVAGAPAASRSMAESNFGSGGGGSLDDLLSGVGGLAEQAPPPPRERKDFKDLGYWLASCTTDKQGAAAISFTMPDDLTKWRFTMIGGDKKARLVEFKDKTQSSQDLMVKLEAPRALVVKDSCFVTAVIHNYTENEQKAVAVLAADNQNAGILSAPKRELTIGKNGTARVDWIVRVLKPSHIGFTATLTTNEGGDMETRTYPILIHGLMESRSASGIVEEKEMAQLSFPRNSDPASRKIKIEYAPTLVYALFTGLDYLVGYPYGCVEQTMSRFLPNLYVDQAMQKTGLKDDSLHARILEYTREGIKRLTQMQNSDGSWGWWGSNQGDGRMTSYVLSGLWYAKNHGYAIDEKSFAQGCGALLELFSAEKKGDKNDLENLAVMTYPLYLVQQDQDNLLPGLVDKLYAGRNELSSQSLGLLLEILHGLGQKERTAVVLALLEKKAVRTQTQVYWTGSSSYYWHSQDVEASAGILKALLRVKPDHPSLPGLVKYLSIKREHGYWVCTKTTAQVALSEYVVKTGEMAPDYQASILVNGQEVKSFKAAKSDLKNWQGTMEYLVKPDVLDHEFVVRKKGKGVVYYTISLLYCAQEDTIRARGKNLKVTREYTRLVYGMGKDEEWEVKREPFKGTLKSGEELEVKITLTSDSHYEHMMLEDFFPQGMEVEKKTQDYYNRWCHWWFWGYANSEARDDRMVFFMDYVWQGERVFTYILRAETPGLFHALPAQAQLMYNPEVRGNSKEDFVRITE
jgi:uncharacterized protein YfaS (alpha-2-macroglobulin family)